MSGTIITPPNSLRRHTVLTYDWPLNIAVNKRMFFGHIMALGIFVEDMPNPPGGPYADFHYKDQYVRYRLPRDNYLIFRLQRALEGNVSASVVLAEKRSNDGQVYGAPTFLPTKKIWIEAREGKYRVDVAE